MRRAPLALLLILATAPWAPRAAHALQAQPVPIPEDLAAMPQIEINGVGIGTLGYGNRFDGSSSSYRGAVDFSDSALLVGAAQRLYEGGGIGSMGFGLLAPDTANSGFGPAILIHQAFLDYQTERTEWLVGRTDNPSSHLVDFPTIREEDLILFTNPLDPFSSGTSAEDHRYSNTAAFTLNQGLQFFESVHAQHLTDGIGAGASPVAINSYGATFEYRSPPGLEALSRLVSGGAGLERQDNGTARGINQLFAGGVVNLNESLTDRVDVRLLELVNLGTSLTQFQSLNDTFQASYETTAASLRYLHSPFGQPGYQLSLTGAYRTYFGVAEAQSFGLALTAVRRLGAGFDLALQYEAQWRDAAFAGLSDGRATENVVEAGFIFDFNATFNRHLSARRTLLNTQHEYIPD